MIRKALKKLTGAKDTGLTGSVQERLNRMRQGGNPSPAGNISDSPRQTRKSLDPLTNEVIVSVPEDEDFIEQFKKEMNRLTPGSEQDTERFEMTTERLRQGIEQRRSSGSEPGNGSLPAGGRLPLRPEGIGAVEPGSFPEKGTLLRISQADLAIFNRDVPSKGYQIVFMIKPDGTLTPQGVYLSAYDYQRIGMISKEVLDAMLSGLSWNPESLVEGLDRPQDASLIPALSPPRRSAAAVGGPPVQTRAPEPEKRQVVGKREISPAQSEEKESDGPVRGRWFEINMGRNRSWKAVYWGKDQQGTVVAHQTGGKWTLMHLDLERFGDTVRWQDRLEPGDLKALETDLLRG